MPSNGPVVARRGRGARVVRPATWLTLGAVAALVVTGLFARTPLVNPTGGSVPPGVSLGFPAGYLVLAPICSFFDALSLLTVRQHIGLVLSVIVVYALWRGFRGRRGRSLVRIAVGEVAGVVVLLGGILGVYALAVLVPRPMAYLHVQEPDVLVLDFHSHTNRSHDGRKGFSAEANREWHRRAGFQAAFITDHTYVDTAVAAAARNPDLAGDGTLLFAGREVVFEHEHVVALDTLDPRTTPKTGPAWPVLIQTIPGNLSRVPAPGPGGLGGVVGIEIVDAAPRGLGQTDRDRARILQIADSLNLATVAASDNHGWGWTAAGWNLMHIPGWRRMPSTRLAHVVEEEVRLGRQAAVGVVARRRIHEWGPAVVALLTGPRLVWHLLMTLTWSERVSWILWILILWSLATLWRRRAPAKLAGAPPAQADG
ncbi:MAG: hypothetical protein P8099_02470 [Gemmatimonadota bacterium]|jgi:hypothetical protein